MNLVQKALVLVGALALIESVWGLALPGGVKKIVGWMVKVAGQRQAGLGAAFFVVAVLFAVLVLVDQPLSSWVLLAVAVVCAGAGLLCFQADGIRKWLSILILNRPLPFVRGIYTVELLVALALIWVALAGK